MSQDPLVWIPSLVAMGLLPFLLLTLTCFARISIILFFVRQGLGIGNVPPNLVLNAIALLVSAQIMMPVFSQVYERASEEPAPTEGIQSIVEHWGHVVGPWREFIRLNAGDRELLTAQHLRESSSPNDPLTEALAFILTELQRALEAGVLVLLPFLLIDILVALVLLALGTHMLSPTTVSPPLKILLFLSVDGWSLITSGLGDGYQLP